MKKKKDDLKKHLKNFLKILNVDKLKNQFNENINNVDQDDIAYAEKKGKKKIASLIDTIPNPLVELWDEILLMISLLSDYCKGNYRQIPFKSLAAIVIAILYFAAPLDLIPDFIIGIGYIDDAMVINFALEIIHRDLMDYKNWKDGLADDSLVVA